MQLDLIFSKDEIRLPIATHTIINGLLYRALREDLNFSEQLHQEGYTYLNRSYKLFTFSDLSGRYIVEGKQIVFLQQARLSVRSVDDYCIELLFKYFTQNRQVELEGNAVEISDLSLHNTQIYDDFYTIRTISPITVYKTNENRHTVYFSPQDDDFYSSIIQNARRKWMSRFGSDEGFSLEIEPTLNANFKKCATHFKTTFITAWYGDFVIKAPPKVIDFLYNSGLGSKNSQGFGMFKILN